MSEVYKITEKDVENSVCIFQMVRRYFDLEGSELLNRILTITTIEDWILSSAYLLYLNKEEMMDAIREKWKII